MNIEDDALFSTIMREIWAAEQRHKGVRFYVRLGDEDSFQVSARLETDRCRFWDELPWTYLEFDSLRGPVPIFRERLDSMAAETLEAARKQ